MKRAAEAAAGPLYFEARVRRQRKFSAASENAACIRAWEKSRTHDRAFLCPQFRKSVSPAKRFFPAGALRKFFLQRGCWALTERIPLV